MYLFCSNPDAVFDARLLRDFAEPFGRITRFQFAGGCLICVGSPMSRVARTDRGVRFELFLPGQNEESTNTFDWEVETGRVRFTRSWRGVFTVFFSERTPFIVTSHKKLAALFVSKPSSLKTLAAGSTGVLHLTKQKKPRIEPPPPIQRFDALPIPSFDRIAALVRSNVVSTVGSHCQNGTALLLSGGIDSTVIAAVARELGISLRTFTFALRETTRPDTGLGSDRACASDVAALFGHEHQTILLGGAELVRNVPVAAYLAETARSTIVDELPAHIAVAQYFHARRIRHVLTGEGADDLFGAFPSALRFYRGAQLRSFLQRELLFGLPDELAIIQNIYSFRGITLVHPYWNEELRALGHWLPMRYRIDRQRLMKMVLRQAFADLIPEPFLSRPKGVPRDSAQMREVLEASFGKSPNRYRPLLGKMMERGSEWHEKQLSTLKNN
jgi:asparagine synthetase B (glutamine-hydrolysing)